MSEHQIPKAIAAALVAAQATARAVGKDAKNTHHGYQYASAEGIIIEAREALSGAGLALVSPWDFVPVMTTDPETGQTRPARDGVIGRVVVNHVVIHKDGETYSFTSSTPVIPEKGRPADKAEFASLTANLAYTLRGMLLLPRDDEQASIDARDDRGYTPSEPARQPAPPKSAAPVSQEPPAAAVASDESDRANWEALANDIARRIRLQTDRRVLKDTLVPEVGKAKKDGLPRDLFDWLVNEVYVPHVDSL